jgi:hypothetical protein
MTRTTMLLALAAGLLAAGCTPPPYVLKAPDAFKRFDRGRAFKWITADGVMLKAREVDNYPVADLPFWTDALVRHMEARGYASKSRECFATDRGRDACTLDFVLPHGTEDWVLSETVFVQGDKVILVEVAGPFERYARVEPELRKAMRTFDPGQ